MIRISWERAYKQFLTDNSARSFKKESKLRKKLIRKIGYEKFKQIRKEVKYQFERR